MAGLTDTTQAATPLPSASQAKVAVVAARGLSKAYPRPRIAGGLLGWVLSRLSSAEDVQDEDDDLDDTDEELDEEERAAGWVIRDVNLQLLAGTSTGIVGAAGGGKTTLAKLLAGLVPPTEGSIAVSGRVVPVLDNLTKLMQDSDVRRNVVLLARLLGYSRSWAVRRRAEIIAFAGLEGSERRSRKQVLNAELQRLAISTTLHMDGVAYIVDSSLGARNRDFRERCLEKLDERRQAGAAIVHMGRELEGLDQLCEEILWLDGGKVLARGTSEAVAEAIARHRTSTRDTDAPTPTAKGALLIRFLRVAIGDLRTTDALHAAEEAARNAGENRVDWADIATNAGYDVSEAQRIVDRLSRMSDDLFGNVLASAPVKLVGAHAVHEGPRTLRIVIAIEAAAPGTDIACGVILQNQAGARTRMEQPEPFRIPQPGLYEVEVVLPAGTLAKARYHGTAELSISSDGALSALDRHDLGAFDVSDDEADLESDPPTDLEWHVRRARD